MRIITVFTVFRLLTDFVCLYNYEFWLSLCKIVRSSVILLLPLFQRFTCPSWLSVPWTDVPAEPPLIGPEMKYIVVVRVSVTNTSIMIPFVEEKMYYQKNKWGWFMLNHDLVDVMEYLCHKWPRISSTCRKHFPVLPSFMTSPGL